MQHDDIDVEFKTYKTVLLLAKDAFGEADYTQSEQKYVEALAKARELFPAISNDVATCLLGLGDCWYAANRYTEATEAFRESLSIYEALPEADPQAITAALFRVAKTQDALREYADADATFLKCVESAESELSPGHPLLTTIYEAYANMLQKGHLDPTPDREFSYREKARLSRTTVAAAKNPQKSTLEMTASRSAEEPDDSLLREGIFIDNATKVVQAPVTWFNRHKYISLVLLIVPFLYAYSLFYQGLAPTLNALTHTTVSNPQDQTVLEEFTSKDEKESLNIRSGSVAESVINGQSRFLPYVIPAPGWSEICALFVFSNPGDQWLIKTDYGVIGHNSESSDLMDKNSSGFGITPVREDTRRLVIYRYARPGIVIFWLGVAAVIFGSIIPMRYFYLNAQGKQLDSELAPIPGVISRRYWGVKNLRGDYINRLCIIYAVSVIIMWICWGYHFAAGR